MKKKRYRVASLFSGIGGFELGFESAGFQTVFQCEKDEFCQKILEKHWPKTLRSTDIKQLDPAVIPVSDVWTAGFPCQDVSLARMGPRAGLRGAKSGLFHEFARLVEQRLPRVVLLENVYGLLSSHGGRDFEIVIRTLAELGYGVGWRVFNSKNFGVPQSRQRVYIVGCHREMSGAGQILFESERSEGDDSPSRQNGETPISPFKRVLGDFSNGGPVVQGLAYCLYATSARHTGTDWSRTYVNYPSAGRVRRLLPKECEGIMGFPIGWTDAPVYADQEQLDSARYHALGNAVTPPVIGWIAKRTKGYLEAMDNTAL
jgi:DNA (cytosine-5)-methyltransferase 1